MDSSLSMVLKLQNGLCLHVRPPLLLNWPAFNIQKNNCSLEKYEFQIFFTSLKGKIIFVIFTEFYSKEENVPSILFIYLYVLQFSFSICSCVYHSSYSFLIHPPPASSEEKKKRKLIQVNGIDVL